MAKLSWENAFVRSIFGRHLGLGGDPQQGANYRPALIEEGGNVISFAPPIIKAVTSLSGAGAVTLAGTQVGDKVVSVTDITTAGDASSAFETTITVAGQIQQTASKSGDICLVVVIPQAAV